MGEPEMGEPETKVPLMMGEASSDIYRPGQLKQPVNAKRAIKDMRPKKKKSEKKVSEARGPRKVMLSETRLPSIRDYLRNA
jgi:hypothetical protein